jgi:hypothetical protein
MSNPAMATVAVNLMDLTLIGTHADNMIKIIVCGQPALADN